MTVTKQGRIRKSFCKSMALILIVPCFLLMLPDVAHAEVQRNEFIVITNNDDGITKVKNEHNVIGESGDALTVEMTEGEASSLLQNEDIQCVERDFTIEAEVDAGWEIVKPISEDWNIQAINAENASSERSVKVAILDSGIDMTDNINVTERKNFIEDMPVETPLFEDTCGHGTSVASVLVGTSTGSTVEGVDSNIDLYSARVLDKKKQAPVSRIVEAIFWAIEKDVDIINISFGTQTYSEALKIAVNTATENGILVVAATGNRGSVGVDYPAAFDSVLAVGSTNAAGELSDFSGVGSAVDVVAPGEAVLTQGNFGEDLVLSGTSLAAPHVSGVAALLWSKDLTKPASFIKTLIKLSARDMAEYGSGYDLIDYEYALQIYEETARQFETVASGNISNDEEETELQEALEPESEVNSGESSSDEQLTNEEQTDEECNQELSPDSEIQGMSMVSATEEREQEPSQETNTPPLDAEQPSDETQVKVDAPDINSVEFEDEVLEHIDVDVNAGEAIDFSDPIVDGSWRAAMHRGVIANSSMKLGATYPDEVSFMEGMTSHPEFHGYSWHGNPSSTSFNSGTCNYVANYNYMVKLAQSYAKGNGYMAVPAVSGQSNTCYVAIRSAIQDLLDSEEAMEDSSKRVFWGKSDNVQKYFIMGIAAHTATDAFAHSTFETSSAVGTTGVWRRITHAIGENGLKKADDPGYKPQRSEMASDILQNVMQRSASVTSTSNVGNSSNDFYVGSPFYSRNLKFRISKLNTFASNAGASPSYVTDFARLTTALVT